LHQALKSVNEAVRLNAQDKEARELRARLYLDLGRSDEAAAECAVASRLPRAAAL
jgi:Flp pilus assembly protein TadD